MGNTTRRQPVNFGIPSAPDYKFLNVVDFRGIDVSDNPFVVKQNTASDALNVYVDESNALTTRPRLNQKYQIGIALRNDFVETLFAYKLNTKTLFQCQMTDSVKFYLKDDNDDTITEIVSDFAFDNTKYAVFEDNDKIYLANNTGYYVIKSDNKVCAVFNDTDTFVPITLTGFVESGKNNLVSIAPENLLSSKYRVSYHWDLTSDFSSILKDGGVVVENKYVNSNVFPTEANLFTTTVPFDNDFLLATKRAVKDFDFKITSVDGENFTPLDEEDLPKDFEYDFSQQIFKGISDFSEDVVGDEYLIYSSTIDGVETLNTITIKYVDKKANVIYFTTNNSDLIVGVATRTIERQIFEVRSGTSTGFQNITDRSRLSFRYTGDVLFKGFVNHMPKEYIGRKFRFPLDPQPSGSNTVRIIHIEDDVVYFAPIISPSGAIGLTKLKLMVYSDNNNPRKVIIDGNIYNYDNGVKQSVDMVAMDGRFYTPSPEFLCCYNPKANAFVVADNRQFYLTTGLNDRLTYQYIPEEASTNREYLFDGVARKNIYINDDATLIIAAVVNEDELGVESTTDWRIIAIDTTSSSYKETVIYTNDDTNFPYYYLNMFVSEDLTKIVIFGNNQTTSINNMKFITNIGLDNQATVDISCEGLPLTNTEDGEEIMFSKDLTRMMRADRSNNTLIYHMFDLNDATYLTKNIKVPKTLNVWSMSPDGLFACFVSDQSADAELYRWYVDNNTVVFVSKIDERLFIDPFNSPNVFGVATDGATMMGLVQKQMIPNDSESWQAHVFINTLVASKEPSLIVEYDKNEITQNIFFNKHLRFDNNYFFYGCDNKLYITDKNNPTYISRSLQLGKTEDPITDMLLISYDTAMSFKEKSLYVIKPLITDSVYGYQGIEAKSNVGAVSPGAAIISPLTETPLYVGLTGVYAIQSLKNVQSTDKISVLYSEAITNLKDSEGNIKFMDDLKKKNIISTKRLYWTLFVSPDEEKSNIYLLDDRTASWFVWTIPVKIVGCWAEEDVIYFADNNGKVYDLSKTDIINKYNPNVTEYYDDGGKLIDWYWKSQILPMGTINYSKKLIDTTFILSDTDSMDEYGLNYKYRIFRKSATETKETTIQNDINYVQSTTKRTLIPRFNFIQLELSNIEDDLNNNKLRLIGLGLKYVLLEGLY